jgi:cytochrome c oxidase subunit IV
MVTDTHLAHHRKIYFIVFGCLLLGTFLTVLAALFDVRLGGVSLNAPIALIIATCKALLVILFFMHVKDSDRLTKITVTMGFFWLGILLVLTMSDFMSRGWGH